MYTKYVQNVDGMDVAIHIRMYASCVALPLLARLIRSMKENLPLERIDISQVSSKSRNEVYSPMGVA